MKEYQIQKDRKRVLPSEVYYQCLWVVKDMNRLQEIAGMEFRREMLAEDVLTYGNTAMQESPVAAEAMFKLDCIHRALMEIPEIYREGIIENIQTRRTGYPCSAHENPWKKWKQRFIYMLAENLRLIP